MSLDIILHLAAETHVDRSIQGAAEFVNTNVMGTYNMLDAAKNASVKKFIHVSTDEIYGEMLNGEAYEGTHCIPSSPYAASKLAGDAMARSFHRTYGLPVVIARPCNVFGPYQYPEKLIPFFVTRALRGETLPLYGNGRQRREWMHVDDLCLALDLLIKHGAPGQAYNVTTGHEMMNLDVARQIQNHFDVEIEYVKDRPGHDRRYAMDGRKFTKQILAHEPDVSFGRAVIPALADTIQWYIDHQDWCERRLEESKAYFEAQYGKE